MSYAMSGLGELSSPGGWGQLVTKDGFRYQITDEDVLWIARAAACEGGGEQSHKAVPWTWAARFVLPNFRQRFSSLKSLVRAHSQPVNPIWARGGSQCSPGGPYAGRDNCAENVLRNREICSSRSWESISPSIRDIVTKWATAQLPNPLPKSVDFASSTLPARGDDVELARYRSGSRGPYNVFYSEAASRSRPVDFLTIQHQGREAGPGGGGLASAAPFIGVAGVGVAAVFAGWAWWRYRKNRA